MKMRVLFVADSLMAGGIESQLVALALGLDRAHFEPYVLSLYGPRARELHYAPALLPLASRSTFLTLAGRLVTSFAASA